MAKCQARTGPVRWLKRKRPDGTEYNVPIADTCQKEADVTRADGQRRCLAHLRSM